VFSNLARELLAVSRARSAVVAPIIDTEQAPGMSCEKTNDAERARWAADILQRRLRSSVRPGSSYVVFDQQEGAIVVEALKAKAAKPKKAKTARKPRVRLAPPDQRLRMIAEAAYYRAMARGFESGHELEDWLAAERELGAD
jgi:hypothetical protein